LATTARHGRGRFTGSENDEGEALLTRLLTRSGATPRVIALVQGAWAHDTFRKYRRTLTRVREYLQRQNTEEMSLTDRDRAQWILADFLADSMRRYSGAVALEMNGQLNRVVALFDPQSEHSIAKIVARAARRRLPRRVRRYDTIWDLDQLLTWMQQNWAENALLSRDDLMTKTMMLVMIFCACRLAELARMEWPETTGAEEQSLVLRAITKQKQTTLQDFVMRRATLEAICPVSTLHAWMRKAAGGKTALLFHQGGGQALTREVISHRFVKVFAAAGILSHYTAYSLKHAVVTKLYNLGATDEEVCAYGHWAPGSRTPRQWYYIPVVDRNWLGAKIVTSFADTMHKAVLERLAEEARGEAKGMGGAEDQ
jgi:site-specific recombinase XerD